MQKIIGLDIGSYSIKAVEILSHFKSYEISNHYEKIITQDDDLPKDEQIVRCMQQLFAENKIKADRIISAMPGQHTSSRILSFNFTDHKKIEAAVYSEIEDMVPYSIEDMIVDHQIIGTFNKKTTVLAVMTRKEFVASFLDKLQKIDIDPKIVDIDSLAFYNLCPYLGMKEGKCYGIVDIGHEKTSVCIVQNGVLRMFRSLNLGGRYLTEHIAQDLEINYAEAQNLKHEINSVIQKGAGSEVSLSKKDREVAERITAALHPICKSLSRTLYAFKSWEKAPIESLFLSGGTSLIRGLDHSLESHLGVKVVKDQLANTNLRINSKIKPNLGKLVQGIAIGMRAVTSIKEYSQINMRKDEFAYIKDYESLFKQAGSVMKSVAYILILLVASYGVKYYIYDKEISTVQSQYKKEFTSLFPELKRKYSGDTYSFDRIHRDATIKLKNRIATYKASLKIIKQTVTKSGSLLALLKLSETLPKDIKVNVVEYSFVSKQEGLGDLLLRVEADSFDMLEKFEEVVNGIDVFAVTVLKSSDSKPGSNLKIAEYELNYKPVNL